MSIMSEQLEKEFELCISRVIETRESDKIRCCIMNLKTKVLLEMVHLKRKESYSPARGETITKLESGEIPHSPEWTI